MMSKELEMEDQARETEGLHPLWEEYKWPAADENGKLFDYADGDQFYYANPYSGIYLK